MFVAVRHFSIFVFTTCQNMYLSSVVSLTVFPSVNSKFTVEYAIERILKLVSIWQSFVVF